MMIEHTSGSIEDKPETEKCGGALRRSTRCFNQQSLLGQPTQHVSQQSSKQPHGQLKVNPRKVNAAPMATTTAATAATTATTTAATTAAAMATTTIAMAAATEATMATMATRTKTSS